MLIDMDINDVREFEKQKHKETNNKVKGSDTRESTSSNS